MAENILDTISFLLVCPSLAGWLLGQTLLPVHKKQQKIVAQRLKGDCALPYHVAATSS